MRSREEWPRNELRARSILNRLTLTHFAPGWGVLLRVFA